MNGDTSKDLLERSNKHRKIQAQRNLDFHRPSRLLRADIVQYMQQIIDKPLTVAEDAEALLFGYLELERLGVMYFHHDGGDSKWRMTSYNS